MGLVGDRYFFGTGTHLSLEDNQTREISIISQVEIDEAKRGGERTSPEVLRRNIVVSGIQNLHELIGQRIRLGEVLIFVSGPCGSRSPGNEKHVPNIGGITGHIINDGVIQIGSKCAVVSPSKTRT